MESAGSDPPHDSLLSRGLTALRSLFRARRRASDGPGRLHAPNPGYLPPGTNIGAYEVAGLVGSGGFGFVYRVTRDSKPYALKISKWRGDDLDPEDRAESEKRLDREISALMSFRHPNIVRVHGFERWPSLEDGYPYIVMDFVEGEHLNEWRKQTSPTLRRACEVIAAIADALGYIHRCGVFHRDLKSENVLVRRADGSPVIVDFGISRLREADSVTRIGYALGTVTHYAPEYAEFVASPALQGGSFEWRPETDLHALGYISYELLTGFPPFPKATRTMGEAQLLHVIRSHVPPPPSVRTGGRVPASLDHVVMRLLAKKPGDRYASGDEVALAIRRATRDGGPAWDEPLRSSTEDLSSTPTPRWTRRPPGTVPEAPAPIPATPRDLPPASAAVSVEPEREGDYEVVDLDSSALEAVEGADPLGRARPEDRAASVDEVRRDRAMPALGAARRDGAALPRILLGVGALVLLGFLGYVLVPRPSGQPTSSGARPPLPTEEGRGAARAPGAPTPPHPDPVGERAERAKEARPTATSALEERPAAAGVPPREERPDREREAKLAQERDAREAAQHERGARDAAKHDAAKKKRDAAKHDVAKKKRDAAKHDVAKKKHVAKRDVMAKRDVAQRDGALAREIVAAEDARRDDSNPGLGKDEVQAVVSSAQGSFEKCLQAERQKSGPSRQVKLDGRRVVLRVKIQPTGMISYPTFDDVTLRGTELGSCLLDAAKRMRFPAFEGERPPLDVPIVLHE